jgi:hypothetical protein
MIDLCEACNAHPADHTHHILPQQKLKVHVRSMRYSGTDLNLRALLDDPRNHMRLCHRCHWNHEGWARRLTRDRGPGSAWEFAADLGPWATYALERAYPERRAA